jgi:hypothetical protein
MSRPVHVSRPRVAALPRAVCGVLTVTLALGVSEAQAQAGAGASNAVAAPATSPAAAPAVSATPKPLAAPGSPEVATELPEASLRGTARLRFLGMHIYDAKLWAKDGFAPEAFDRHPLALELIYGRSLVGSMIAERSLKEMKRVAEVPADRADRWLGEMKKLFPDVKEGDRITGVLKPAEAARFYVNGRFRGEVRDAEFARAFFGIWLSERTSEPEMRSALIGRSRGR